MQVSRGERMLNFFGIHRGLGIKKNIKYKFCNVNETQHNLTCKQKCLVYSYQHSVI